MMPIVPSDGLLALVSTINQRVRWQARIEYFAGRFYACHRQGAGIEQTKLNEHGGLVPVDVLVDQLTIPESDNRDHRYLNLFSCRNNAGQHPVHSYRMGEFDNHLIDHLIGADSSRYRNHLRVGRHLRNETFGVNSRSSSKPVPPVNTGTWLT